MPSWHDANPQSIQRFRPKANAQSSVIVSRASGSAFRYRSSVCRTNCSAFPSSEPRVPSKLLRLPSSELRVPSPELGVPSKLLGPSRWGPRRSGHWASLRRAEALRVHFAYPGYAGCLRFLRVDLAFAQKRGSPPERKNSTRSGTHLRQTGGFFVPLIGRSNAVASAISERPPTQCRRVRCAMTAGRA